MSSALVCFTSPVQNSCTFGMTSWLHEFEPIIDWKMMKITAEEIRSRGAFASVTCLNLYRSKHAAMFWIALCTLFCPVWCQEKTHTLCFQKFFYLWPASLVDFLLSFLWFLFYWCFKQIPSFSCPSVLNLRSNFFSLCWEISIAPIKTVLKAELSSYGFLF